MEHDFQKFLIQVNKMSVVTEMVIILTTTIPAYVHILGDSQRSIGVLRLSNMTGTRSAKRTVLGKNSTSLSKKTKIEMKILHHL